MYLIFYEWATPFAAGSCDVICMQPSLSYVLKGQCHEDFAVLDQFWAKIITFRLYSLTKCFCKVTTKISNEFYHRGLTIIKFLRIF